MFNTVLSEISTGITEFKHNPMKAVEEAGGEPVAILNRNAPAFYLVPPKLYEEMLAMIEDAGLGAIADARADGENIPVSLDEL